MQLTSASFLQEKKIILISHISNTGFFHHLKEYLVNHNTNSIFFITHPLHPKRDKLPSKAVFTRDQGRERVFQMQYIPVPNIINFFKDFFLNMYWVLKTKETWDLCIAADGLNVLSALTMKKFGKIKKVVFYSVDFVPKRFTNPFLDALYHWMDKLATVHSDEVWVLSERMIEGRRDFYHLKRDLDKKQHLIPEGVWIDRIERKQFSSVSTHSAVFLGHVIERMGVQLVIRAIPIIKKTIPDFHFIIIGKGEYLPFLQKLAGQLGVKEHIMFKGFIANHREVEDLIASCGIGVATYTHDKTGLTYFADPAKIKIYLGASLPVIMTDTFYYAKDIERKKAGKVVAGDPKGIASAIIELLESNYLQLYRENALQYAKQFDYPYLFTKNLTRVLT